MNEDFNFADEGEGAARYQRPPWKLLIVDDDPEVHRVTRLALADFQFASRSLAFLHAYSASEAKELLQEHKDIALALLDVVMESDHAGLELVQYIRNEMGNRFVRLVLRTGQPGQAPEMEVITRYDINDYKYKTELTRERLFATVYTSLSVYRDLMALDANRRGLEKVIEASAHIFELRSADVFAEGVLEQLTALLFLDKDAVMVHAKGLAAEPDAAEFTIVAATGSFASMVGQAAVNTLPKLVLERIGRALHAHSDEVGEDYYVGVQTGRPDLVFYVAADAPISLPDRRMISLFNRNVALAYENLALVAKAEQTKAVR